MQTTTTVIRRIQYIMLCKGRRAGMKRRADVRTRPLKQILRVANDAGEHPFSGPSADRISVSTLGQDTPLVRRCPPPLTYAVSSSRVHMYACTALQTPRTIDHCIFVQSITIMTESGASVVVRRPLSPRKFFAMLYETDAVDVRRPQAVAKAAATADDMNQYELRRSRMSVPAATVDTLQQTVVVVRPAAAYIEHTFAAGLTAFRKLLNIRMSDLGKIIFKNISNILYFEYLYQNTVFSICIRIFYDNGILYKVFGIL